MKTENKPETNIDRTPIIKELFRDAAGSQTPGGLLRCIISIEKNTRLNWETRSHKPNFKTPSFMIKDRQITSTSADGFHWSITGGHATWYNQSVAEIVWLLRS